LTSKVDLPHLKALDCVAMSGDRYYLSLIRSHWSMHNLERLSVPGIYGIELLQVHGHRLKFLHIPGYQSGGVWQLLTHCPSLEHLVISANCPVPTFHPTIAWVDIWAPTKKDQQPHYEALRDSLPAAFPALCGVRQLDLGLNTVLDLASMLQDPMNDGGDFKYDFPGISIIYSSGAFIKTDMMMDLDGYETYEESDGCSSSDDPNCAMVYDDTSDPWYTDESSMDEDENTDTDPDNVL